jgi:hypothetical protein
MAMIILDVPSPDDRGQAAERSHLGSVPPVRQLRGVLGGLGDTEKVAGSNPVARSINRNP